MRVALVGSGLLPIPPEGYGAVERHIWELARHLRERGVEAEIVTWVFGSEYRFIPWVVARLRRLHPDLVHAHTSAVGAILSVLHKNLIFTSHNPAWTTKSVDLRSLWGLSLEKFLARRAAAFVALDGRVGTRVSRFARHPHVVHGAIDASEWQASGLEGGFALSVGYLDRRKGFHKYAEQKGDTRYVVAGKSVGERGYERSLQSLGVELHLNPSNQEIRKLYETASVYVHPSEFDAFSLAVLESMASGLPVVASEVCTEQVLQGENGFLVTDDDYVTPVRRILSDDSLRNRLGARSRELVETRFSWDMAVDRIIAIYQGVLGSP